MSMPTLLNALKSEWGGAIIGTSANSWYMPAATAIRALTKTGGQYHASTCVLHMQVSHQRIVLQIITYKSLPMLQHVQCTAVL